MGVTNLLSLQAFLAYPKELPEDIVVGVLKGMRDFMERHDAKLSGGQTIKNPVPVFGGIVLGTAHPKDIVYSLGAKVGDVVLLTKPLGIQPAMRSYRDLKDEKRDALLSKFKESDLKRMQDVAVRLMTFSNLEIAQAMRSVEVNAATDVTGFGLLGHAGNVSSLSGVDVVIDQIPTAGGMLVFLDSGKEEEFRGILSDDNLPCWPVGKVVKAKGSPCARLAQDVQFIETEFP
jgi:selenide,water dikinase